MSELNLPKNAASQEAAAPQGADYDQQTISNLALHGDLKGLTDQQKIAYYRAVCDSLGLNPLTSPFQILKLDGKEVLYAKRDATDQLRKVNGVSVVSQQVDRSFADQGVYMVWVTLQDKQGRTDTGTGAVNINGLKPDQLANAAMKAETKAKRRATLSICGLGMLDEAETDTVPAAGQEQDIVNLEASSKAYQFAKEALEQLETVEEMRNQYGEVLQQARAKGLSKEHEYQLKQELKTLAKSKKGGNHESGNE
jgi:hypothetical protein